MGKAPGIIYRTIAARLTHQADYTKTTAQNGDQHARKRQIAAIILPFGRAESTSLMIKKLRGPQINRDRVDNLLREIKDASQFVVEGLTKQYPYKKRFAQLKPVSPRKLPGSWSRLGRLRIKSHE